jgi:hypothetical protein
MVIVLMISWIGMTGEGLISCAKGRFSLNRIVSSNQADGSDYTSGGQIHHSKQKGKRYENKPYQEIERDEQHQQRKEKAKTSASKNPTMLA